MQIHCQANLLLVHFVCLSNISIVTGREICSCRKSRFYSVLAGFEKRLKDVVLEAAEETLTAVMQEEEIRRQGESRSS